MSRPSNRTVPDAGLTRPSSAFPMVLLPEPDSPTRPSVWPLSISKLTLSTARNGWCRPRLNSTDRRRTLSSGGWLIPASILGVLARGQFADAYAPGGVLPGQLLDRDRLGGALTGRQRAARGEPAAVRPLAGRRHAARYLLQPVTGSGQVRVGAQQRVG